MTGMSRTNGKALSEDSHIAQSIGDILTTPIGSRLIRRSYGSLIPELIDQPLNNETRLRVMSATVDAITRWEKRIKVTGIEGLSVHAGSLALTIKAQRQRDGQSVTLEVKS